MYKQIHSIAQNDRCCTVAIDNGDNFLCYSNDIYLTVYNKKEFVGLGEDSDPLYKLKSNDSVIFAQFNSEGDKLAISDMDYAINVYDVYSNFRQMCTLNPGTLKSWKFEFSPNGRQIATGCYAIQIYDIDMAELIKEIPNDLKYFYSLCYLNDNHIAAGNSNGSIHIYSVDNSKKIHKIEEHCLAVRCLTYDKFNTKLLSASDDLHINLYDTNTFQVICPLVGHKDFISSLCVNNEKNIIATSSFDGTIKIWDARQGKCVQTIPLSSDGSTLWDIAIDKKGDLIISGGESGMAAISL